MYKRKTKAELTRQNKDFKMSEGRRNAIMKESSEVHKETGETIRG